MRPAFTIQLFSMFTSQFTKQQKTQICTMLSAFKRAMSAMSQKVGNVSYVEKCRMSVLGPRLTMYIYIYLDVHTYTDLHTYIRTWHTCVLEP